MRDAAVAVQRRGIGLLQRDAATRTREVNRLLEQALRRTRGARHEAHVDEVEALGGQSGTVGVAQEKLDICGGSGAGVLEERQVHVEPEDAVAPSDPLAQQPGDPVGPAADIEARPALGDTDEIEHSCRVGCHGGALNVQALDLAAAALDRVIARIELRHGTAPAEAQRTLNSASGRRAEQ
jgi:hypothetical protein